ncbi:MULTISPECIES: NYN domain-containing protein [Methanobacterium]|uniref:NYN domain-containing protein n=1 Tax=Methanobacterium veterum TaxID=408577 RepID=A0A9E5A9F5_9EURY|nr:MULTISPECIES: NYN domain-containing protein [Methanobacterium]MCZ3367075.1 NYN domain-containing protein [Methanobacterium veterum]MCZ3373778.1 NYN domain-containing protein [Methanobacterium veterum]
MLTKGMVFVDGNYFYKGLEDHRIDFCSLGQHLCSPYNRLFRLYYYNVQFKQEINPNTYKEQQKFFDAIRNSDYVILRRANNPYEANIKLIVDMIRYASNDSYDVGILVSNNPIFQPAIEAVKGLSKNIELASFKWNRSRKLRDICDREIEINEKLLNKCPFRK